MTDEEGRQADSDRRQQLQIQGDTINADVGLMHEREERIVQLEVCGGHYSSDHKFHYWSVM